MSVSNISCLNAHVSSEYNPRNFWTPASDLKEFALWFATSNEDKTRLLIGGASPPPVHVAIHAFYWEGKVF
jgi:hypothetical protein